MSSSHDGLPVERISLAERPRLLLVSRKWPPAIGGMETYAVELQASLQEHFALDTLALPGRPDGRPPGLARYLAFVLRAMLRCLIWGRRYEAVVFGDLLLFPAALAHRLVAPRASRLVVVYGLDVVYGRRLGLLPALYARYLRLVVALQDVFDGIIAISRHTAALAEAAGLRAPVVITPSLPDTALTRAAAPTVDIAPLTAGFARTLLCFGRLVPRKGAAWLATQVLPALPEDVGLLVVGPATDPSQLALLRAQPRVRCLGPVDTATLAALIRGVDLVLMPNVRVPDATDVEGFGLVAIETSALGGRLLAARLDGIEDAVVDGVTGTLVEPGDARAWRDAIVDALDARLHEAPGRQAEIAEATRHRYSRQAQAAAFAALVRARAPA